MGLLGRDGADFAHNDGQECFTSHNLDKGGESARINWVLELRPFLLDAAMVFQGFWPTPLVPYNLHDPYRRQKGGVVCLGYPAACSCESPVT